MHPFPSRPFSGTLTTGKKSSGRSDWEYPHDFDRLPVEGEVELIFEEFDTFDAPDATAAPRGVFEFRGAVRFPPKTFHPTRPDQTLAAGCLFRNVFRLETADGLAIDLIFVHVSAMTEPNVVTAKFRSKGVPISVPEDEDARAVTA